MNIFDAEGECLKAVYESGYMKCYEELAASGYGPQFPWLAVLEADVQLFREDVEGGLDGDAFIKYTYWMMQEAHLQPLRLCQAFLRGVWYEREHPEKLKF